MDETFLKAAAAIDFFVDALEKVGAPDLFPVLGRKVAEGKHITQLSQYHLAGD